MKTVLLFPGQGSQQLGMGQFLYNQFDEVRKLYQEASDALGIDMKKLCFDSSDAELAKTENTQPALLLVSTATQETLRRLKPIEIQAVAGHSIGEYAALVAARSIRFSDAIKAVRLRGQSMQEAVPFGKGAMAAVLGLSDSQVIELCKQTVEKSKLGPLSPANFNCPGQIVISGAAESIQWLKENLEQIQLGPEVKKIKMIPLNVSAPFHCEMMLPAENIMRQVLSQIEFSDAQIPVLQNFTAEFHTNSVQLRENLIRQVSAPVRWTESQNRLVEKNYLTAIECGVGTVLKGLAKKTNESFVIYSTNKPEEFEQILAM